MQSIKDKIVSRIYGKGRGYAFSPKDFLDIANRGSVDTALSTLCVSGKIRRVAHGVYDYPRFNELLSKYVPPDIDQVTHAIARKHGWRIQATGAMAANLLGLSTQVPAKVVYLIDGPGKSIKVGNTTVQFKKAAPKDLNVNNRKSALVIQALKFLGRKSVDPNTLSQISQNLSAIDRKKLLNDARFGTDWIFEAAKLIYDQAGVCHG